MRAPGPPPDHRGVPPTVHHPIAIRLLVEPGSDPIEGSLTADDGPAIAFRGWLELASAIERSHERHRRHTRPRLPRSSHDHPSRRWPCPGAVAGFAVFIAATLIAAAATPGYHPARENISALASLQAPHPWIMLIGFAGLSASAAAAGIALRGRLAGRSGTVASVCLLVVGSGHRLRRRGPRGLLDGA